MRRARAASVLGALAFFLTTGHAQAALRLCNQTSYVLYAATASTTRPMIITQGWTRIAPGACEQALPGVLAAMPYYVYARTSQAHSGPSHVWGGQAQFCAKNGNFMLRAQMGLAGCASDDSFPMPFSKLDTQAMKSWTTTFTEGPNIPTMEAARNAGIDRLLADIGYKANRGGGPARDAALKKFRARMKLPDNATSNDLIDALETEALKAAAPAGYSICNDSNSAIWAALALKPGKDWVTRGWWKVTPGSCARAISDALSFDRIYLHVEGHGDHHLVSGPELFCITDITFDVTGRGACAKHGLAETGFAVTNTKGRSGYVVHISQDGLVPQH